MVKSMHNFFLQVSLSILLLSSSLCYACDPPQAQPSPSPVFSFAHYFNDHPPTAAPDAADNNIEPPPTPSSPASDEPPPTPSSPASNEPPPTPSSPASNDGGSFSGSASINYKGAFSKVFSFGDSYTDTGNAALMGGIKSSFIGSLFSHAFKSLNASQPSGNRLSNGGLVVDFLCDNLGVPYLPPYKQSNANFSNGCNFAIGGATSLSNNFFSRLKGNNNNGLFPNLMWKGIPSGFQTQLDWFNKFMQETACQGKSESECKDDMQNALFWIGGMGRNDYARAFSSKFDISHLRQMTLTHISKFLQTLTANGAKYVVVQGLPPVGCCPLELLVSKSNDRDQMGCAAGINALINAHNELLQKMLANFQKQNPHCTIVYADFWNAVKTIMANPKKFNFQEPFKACCGTGGGPLNFNPHTTCGMPGTSACQNPSQHINWDGIHFTEAMHKQLTDLFLHKGYCKPSFNELVQIKTKVTKGATKMQLVFKGA